MSKVMYFNAQAGSWAAPLTRPTPKVQVAVAGCILGAFDSDEPSDEMIAKIKSVVDQSQFTADESL